MNYGTLQGLVEYEVVEGIHHGRRSCTTSLLWLKRYTDYRDTHIMLSKIPIMLCSDSQHQANYLLCSQLIVVCRLICDITLGNLLFMITLF